jgi:hypothetical protein
MEEIEVELNYNSYAAKVMKRKAVPITEVVVTLIDAPRLPDPKDSTYPNAWAMFEYEVEKAISGSCDSDRIYVARWVWMKYEPLTSAKANTGNQHRLLLEPYELNPQIHSARQFELDEIDFDIPFYYDVGPLK